MVGLPLLGMLTTTILKMMRMMPPMSRFARKWINSAILFFSTVKFKIDAYVLRPQSLGKR